MRKFHTVISFAIMIAVTVVVLGLFSSQKSKPAAPKTGGAVSLRTETSSRLMLFI